ncbi:hypothetical protein [Pseudophaeobacter flagellatus]|uniref:hypothetical protein n=1 Tax=Pseudophaeobacter flagellatus TaxID=2899119 RepID=UPI001E4DE891|nr:hypothetical protein [Pseudophaeobacter flagellatus]MCD9146651.1 hypothetical protein [Pseudophaeobacter flagellatus]
MKTLRVCISLALGFWLSACSGAEIPSRNASYDTPLDGYVQKGTDLDEIDILALGVNPQSIIQTIGMNVLGPQSADDGAQ